MMYGEHHIRQTTDPRHNDRPMRGFILDAPASQEDPLWVVVPGISGDMMRGPCLWTPRPGVGGVVLPTGGEACVLQEDSDKQCWVQAWTPYAE